MLQSTTFVMKVTCIEQETENIWKTCYLSVLSELETSRSRSVDNTDVSLSAYVAVHYLCHKFDLFRKQLDTPFKGKLT